MAQGNDILHDAGDTNEQPNLKLTPYVKKEIVDAPEPTVDKVLDGREDDKLGTSKKMKPWDRRE